MGFRSLTRTHPAPEGGRGATKAALIFEQHDSLRIGDGSRPSRGRAVFGVGVGSPQLGPVRRRIDPATNTKAQLDLVDGNRILLDGWGHGAIHDGQRRLSRLRGARELPGPENPTLDELGSMRFGLQNQRRRRMEADGQGAVAPGGVGRGHRS